MMTSRKCKQFRVFCDGEGDGGEGDGGEGDGGEGDVS